MTGVGRCPAAHPEDPAPCEGPVVVQVTDAFGGEVVGCVLHGARLYASLTDPRVYPLPGAAEGAAIEVYRRAQALPPFAWRERDTPGEATS